MGLFDSMFNSKISDLRNKAKNGDVDAQYELSCELCKMGQEQHKSKYWDESGKWRVEAIRNHHLLAEYNDYQSFWKGRKENSDEYVGIIFNLAKKGLFQAQLELGDYYFKEFKDPYIKYTPYPALVERKKQDGRLQAIKWYTLALENKRAESFDRNAVLDKLSELGVEKYNTLEELQEKLAVVESSHASDLDITSIYETYLTGSKNIKADFDKALMIAKKNASIDEYGYLLSNPGTFAEGNAAIYLNKMRYTYGYGITEASLLFDCKELKNFIHALPSSLCSCDGVIWEKADSTDVYVEYHQKGNPKQMLRIHEVFYDHEPGTKKIMFLTDAGAFTLLNGSSSFNKESIRLPYINFLELPNGVVASFPDKLSIRQSKSDNLCAHISRIYHKTDNQLAVYVGKTIFTISAYGKEANYTDTHSMAKINPKWASMEQEGYDGPVLAIKEMKYDETTHHFVVNGYVDAIAEEDWYLSYKIEPVKDWKI